MEALEQPGGSIGPWLNVWQKFGPTQIKCLTWLVARKSCIAHEVLWKKGFQLVSKYSFVMILQRQIIKLTTQLWSLFFSLTSNNWNMPDHTSDLLSCWIKRGLASPRRDGGEQFLHVFGGQYGRKEMGDASHLGLILYRRSNGIA